MTLVRLLLERGHDVEEVSEAERTPLLYAACWGNVEAVRLLAEAVVSRNEVDEYVHAALHMAAFGGARNVVALLRLSFGRDIDEVNEEGPTPLHIAALLGEREVVKLLVALGADLRNRDEQFNTAPHLAASGGSAEVARGPA